MSTVRPWTDLLICWCPVVSNASDSVSGVVLAGGVAVTWHVLAETGGHACQHRAACARPRYRNYRIRLPMADLGRNQVRMPTNTTPMQETVACSSKACIHSSGVNAHTWLPIRLFQSFFSRGWANDAC